MIYQLSTTQFIILLAATILTIILSIYAANYCLLALISLRVRKKILKAPSLKKWPKVSIHLPLYNEGNVASRLLKSCVNLDYPKNKLEIFLIDDSNDETKNIVDMYGNKYPELINVIHRKFRKGYKGEDKEKTAKKEETAEDDQPADA